MSLKIYLWLMGLASFLALVSLAAILWFFSPQNAGWPILILLFLSLFLALCGFFSLIGFWLRRKNGQAPELLGIALREGALLSGLLVSFMVLKAMKIFWWWSALIFLVIIVAIEIAFLSKQD